MPYYDDQGEQPAPANDPGGFPTEFSFKGSIRGPIIERVLREHGVLADRVRGLLAANHLVADHSTNGRIECTQPSADAYQQEQYSWDSALHAVALSYIDPQRAGNELRALMCHQVKDGPDEGMIPHVRTWAGRFRHSDFGDRDSSWLTNPPLIGVAAMHLFRSQTHSGVELLDDLCDGLMQYHDWFDRRRVVDNDHLAVTISSWETGWDGSPRWIPVLLAMGYELRRESLFEDLQAARKALNTKIFECGCDCSQIIEKGLFAVKPVDFNSIRAADLQALGDMLMILNRAEEARKYFTKADHVREAIRNHMWDDQEKTFKDLIVTREGSVLSGVSSAAAFVTCFGRVPNESQGRALIGHLHDEDKFWTPYPVATDLPHPELFTKDWYDTYWLRNVWPSVQWLVWRGLKNMGYDDSARSLAQGMQRLVEESGFYEYYNPVSGEGLGERNQSWAGLLLDMAEDL